MDAEEEQPIRPEPSGDEELWATAPLVLSPRPLPDVVFGSAPSRPQEPPVMTPVAGPGEITGPQPVVGALPEGGRHRRRMALLVAVAMAGALAVALVAAVLWPSDSGDGPRQAAPATSAPGTGSPPGAVPQSGVTESGQGPEEGPSAGRPSPAMTAAAEDPGPGDGPAAGETPLQPPVSGSTAQGIGVTYRTVEVSAGYFEGEVTLTNETGAELRDWTLSFTYPGASIRNVWNGHLWTGDDGTVTVTGDENTASVPAGASVTIRFGGSGAPSRPRGCAVNGSACGF
ncbi:cellulose binding domain-containing protein [Actinocorallia sp. B10E7]|uniref:cellulose binding domain-containing protein n=1 Tax=Actinocorallia sp. B10E7 TaxID=3153558 RepID=UPI00325CFAC8